MTAESRLVNHRGEAIPAYAKKQYVNPVDNPIELSTEIILGIEKWMAVEVRELDKGNDHDGAEGYGFDKFLAVLNRRCPGVLRAILDAGADVYV